MTDPIADMFTRIRNASKSRHEKVEMPLSKVKQKIAEILGKEGFVSDISISEKEGFKYLAFNLKYNADNTPLISAITRVSKPGLRVYIGTDKIPLVKGGLGVAIVSTSSGIMTGRTARKRKLGGELLGMIW